MPETSARRRTPLIAWFLGFGILDLVAALVLAYVFHIDSPIFRYLLPTLALWGDNPAAPQGFGAILAFLFLFGGSFVLYGLLGVVLGLTARFAVNSDLLTDLSWSSACPKPFLSVLFVLPLAVPPKALWLPRVQMILPQLP